MLYAIAVFLMKWSYSLAAVWNPKALLRVKGLKTQSIPPKGCKKRIWLHCASAGEYEQVIPIISHLKEKSDIEIIVSFFSPSGMTYYRYHPMADICLYLPFDVKKDAEAFIRQLQPDVAIWVKYEFWYQILSLIRQGRIPLYLINADLNGLSEKKGFYGRILRKCLPLFDKVFTVSDASDLKSFCREIELVHDSKWLRAYQNTLRDWKDERIEVWKADIPCIILGSVDAEDLNLLENIIKNYLADYRWLIVPHEVDSSIINHVRQTFSRDLVALYSYNKNQESPVLLLDQLGVLKYTYRYAHAAYVGGGFVKAVHNVLEAAAYGVPVCCGPSIQGIPETQLLKESGLLTIIHQPADFERWLSKLTPSNLEANRSKAKELFSKARDRNASTTVTLEVLRRLGY